MVVHDRIDLIIDATQCVHQDESFDISNTFLRYLEVPESAGILLTFRIKNENCSYHMNIFEKFTTRLTVLFFNFFFSGPDVLNHCGSNGGKIKLIGLPEVG